MNHFLYIVLATGLLALGFVYGLPYFQKPNVDRLVEQALNAPTNEEQLAAAQELSNLERKALPGLRQLLSESENENVVATSIMGLSRQMDYESTDQILAKLDDTSTTVRAATAKASTKLLGRNHHFPVRGTDKERARIRDQILADWERYRKSELFEFNKQRYQQ